MYSGKRGVRASSKAVWPEDGNHMAVLVELANKITHEFKPPRKATKDDIKTKYLAIAKIYGITEAPSAYISLFRKNMPAAIINWSGAPNQGVNDEKT